MERLCYATEFEIEGWKKILPLTEIIEKYIQIPLENMKLKMHTMYAITEPVDGKFNTDDLMGKTIRNSKIYHHFKPKDAKPIYEKLVIYVSQTIPINENYCRVNIHNGQHCVVATGIKFIKDVECLVLENTGGNDDFNSIPVDLPFFEEVSKDIGTILRKHSSDPDSINRKLNNYGLGLAQKKWKNLTEKTGKKDWNAMVQKEAERIKKNQKKDEEPKYQMFFVKGAAPIYKLEFERL